MDKMIYECLNPGDPRACVLLGPQQKPAPGEYIRKNQFVYSLYAEGRYILFHTLTRQLLLIDPQYIDYFTDDRLFQAAVLDQEVPAKLYENHFLVPEHTDESQLYLELKDILVLKEELPKAITNYVILPTTTCNARCFYCFEQGMQYRTMTEETVSETIRFIQEHKPANDKKIHIHWFGGEPMCAVQNIDRICCGLTDAGINFEAEMTSNGSLFTEDLAHKAAEEWKVEKIQITLDGMSEEYAKRKCYINTPNDPFEMVIENMHLLIAAEIKVMIRLNVDDDNLGEIYRVVNFLKEEFKEEEREKLGVYAHSLFGRSEDSPTACPVDSGSDELEARVLEINDYIQRQNLMPHDLGPLFTLKSHYCMVTAPECNVLIDAAGELFACDAMPENMRYGNVKDGIKPEEWNRVAAPCKIRRECRTCVFLPECTEFDRCPNRIDYDNCYRQEKRKLENDLRFAYTLYAQKMEAAKAGSDPEKFEN